MKLLLISVRSEQVRGGIATWTAHFLESCENEGISCRLVNTDLLGRRALQESSRRQPLDEAVRTRRIFRDLRKALRDEDFDAAHLNTSCGAFGLFRDLLIARRIKRRGIRLVTHFHCDIPYWIRNPVSCWALGRLVALSDVRLVLCESSRRYLADTFGADAQKMPNFLNDSLILKEERLIAESLSTLLFVGRVSEEKGAQELYTLAERLPHLAFRAVGAVSETVAAWQKPDNLTLTGALPLSEVFAEMNGADLFLLPSHSEGFSLALTEAMARGLPSVATDVGAAADMLADGCGFVVPAGNIGEMMAAIEALSAPDARREVSRRAVRKVRESYTTPMIFKRLHACYGKNPK